MGGIGPTGLVASDSEQQFALKWNDYHTSILNSFKVLRDQEDFIDVTIACDGMSFMAHKVVLSACSPYFRSLLKANPCQHPIVILHNVREHDMEALLRFMYNGEVHIGQEQLPDFLRTATALQVRGLAEVPHKDRQNLSNIHAVPWSAGDETNSQSLYNSKHSHSVDNPPPSKKFRTNETTDSRYSESPPVNRDSGSENADNKPSSLSDSVLSQSQGDVSQSAQNSHPVLKTVSEPSSQVHSSNEDESDSYDDEASDAEVDNGHSSISDLAQPRLEASDFVMGDRSRSDPLVNSGLYDQQRQRAGFPPIPFNLQNLQDIATLIPGLSGMPNNSQDSYGLMRRNSETGKVRATDPRPCPKCGKIYRSAHTLRTHLEDKHTVCPGYRCVLCGTVAKSRNSLHSHMSRQHRGISTKDLPVVPMPSNFDPDLAAALFKKAGIKMSAAELRARASPTGMVVTRRSDGKSGLPSSPEEEDNGIDLTMNSTTNFHNINQETLPLDFRHSSIVNNKLNSNISLLMNSLLPLTSGVDKENMDST